MFIDNTVFALLLVAVSLVLIAMFVLLVNTLVESRQRQKSQLGTIAGIAKNMDHKCAHSFGYLSLLPRSKPIPDECFGCLLVLDCIKSNPKLTKEETDRQEEHVAAMV